MILLKKSTSLIVLFLLFLVSCSQKEETAKPPPVEIRKGDSCTLCGMIIMDYPGPKAQIHYRDGRVDKFCCVQEMMSLYLQPDRPRGIRAIYVTDMADRDWKSPGRWIDAGNALYVYGASVSGAMGNEIVPFSDRVSAERFMKKHGGRIVRFREITLEMLEPKL
jgi:copper chaperone NosL